MTTGKRASKTPVAKQARARIAGRGDAQALVREMRALTEGQFEFWINALKGAVAVMEGDAAVFKDDNRQKTISWWYVLMYLLEVHAATNQGLFGARTGKAAKADRSFTEGLVSMKQLSHDLRHKFQEETVRRYVSDLKRCNLVDHEGRGPEALVKLSVPAIRALVDTIDQWLDAFGSLHADLEQMRASLAAGTPDTP